MSETAAPPRPNPNTHKTHGSSVEQQQQHVNDETLRIVLASLDKNVDSFAREAAHEKVSEKPTGPLWKRAIKAVWNNAKREYDLVKETVKSREAILESGNLLHHHGKDDTEWREAVVNRYASDYGEKLVREGETFHNLSSSEAQSDPEAQRIREDVMDLVKQFAKGDIIDAQSLEEAQKRMLETWREDGVSQKYIGEGNLLANNIGGIAEQVKAALDNQVGLNDIQRDAKLDEILQKVEIVTGEARVGSTTEIEATTSERLAKKLQNVPFINEGRLSKIVSFLGNETTMAALLSVGAYGAKNLFSKAVTAVVIPGLGGGIIAALRERKALREERALEARRMDNGMRSENKLVSSENMTREQGAMDLLGFGPNSRRSEIDETLYEARSVDALIANLGSAYDEKGELNIMSREDLNKAIQHLAEVKARIEATDGGNRLISFAGVEQEKMESRRFDLQLAAAKLETDLQKLFTNPVAIGMLDIKPDETFENVSSRQQGMIEGVLRGEMEMKDKLFNKLVRKRAFGRFLMGTGLGAVIGVGVETAGGLINVKGGQAGQSAKVMKMSATTFSPPDSVGSNGSPPVSVGGTGSDQAPTSVGGAETNQPPTSVGGERSGAPDSIGGKNGEAPSSVGGESRDNSSTHKLTERSKMNLPEGYNLQQNGDTLTVTTPSGETIEGLQLTKDGTLTADAQEALKGAGLHISESVDIVNGEPKTTTETVSANDFAKNHVNDMKTIHHQGWMDNNTKKFDLNELKTKNGVDANGNVIIDIKGMAGNGSFHGASGVNWQEAAQDGHLKVYLSASVGSQAHAFEVPISPSGQAIISPDSPAAALFDANGKFQGAFQEIALDAGPGKNGATNIVTLSTVVGEHQETFTDTITTQEPQPSHTYTVTENTNFKPAYATPTPGVPSAVPVIPVYGRSRLGKGTPRAKSEETPPSAPPELAAATSNNQDDTGSNPSMSLGSGDNLNDASQPTPEQSAANGHNVDSENQSQSQHGRENSETDSNRNKKSSNVTFPEGYDVPDVTEKYRFDYQEAAVGYIRAAMANVGTDDKDAVLQSAIDAVSPQLRSGFDIYRETAQAVIDLLTELKLELSLYSEGSTESQNKEEKAFFEALDKENLDTPYGYSFPGYAGFDIRDRKQAVRFIREAMVELGENPDKYEVVTRAISKANDAATNSTGKQVPLFKGAAAVLQQLDLHMQTKKEQGKEESRGGEALLNNLDDETGNFPFKLSVQNPNSYSPRVHKLVTRIYSAAKQSIADTKGPMPADTDKEGYRRYMKAVFRKAMSMAQPDQYGSLKPDQRALFEETMKVLGEARSYYLR